MQPIKLMLGEHVKMLVEASPTMLVHVETGEIVKASLCIERDVFGFTTLGWLNGRLVDELVPERFLPKHKAGMAKYLQSPANQRLVVVALDANGAEFDAIVQLAPIMIDRELYAAATIMRLDLGDTASAILQAAGRTS